MEAAYPVLLCERLATIAKLKALELGATEIQDLARQIEHAPSSQHRFLLDKLPKGSKFKPLIPEYGFYDSNFCTISQRNKDCASTVVQGYFSGRCK